MFEIPDNFFVHTSNGIKQVSNIKKGDYILSYKNDNIIQSKVLNIKKIQKQLKSSLYKSTNGLLNVLNDNTYNEIDLNKKRFSYKHKNLSLIKNEIYTSTRRPSHLTIPKNSKCKIQAKMPKDLTGNISWFYGLVLGDGYVSSDGTNKHVLSISFNSNEVLTINKVCDIVQKELDLKRPTVFNTSDNGATVYVHNKSLVQQLRKIKKSNESIHIPKFILEAGNYYKYNFIAGVFDADGSCESSGRISICSKYESFIFELQYLLSCIGINSIVRQTFFKSKELKGYELKIASSDKKKFVSTVGIYSCKVKKDGYRIKYKKTNKTNEQLVSFIKAKSFISLKSNTDVYSISIEENNMIINSGLILFDKK